MKSLLALIATFSVMLCSTVSAADIDWTKVEQALGMGDLVFTESEIRPVMKHRVDNGVEQAQVLHDPLALSKTPLTAAAPAGTPPAIDLDVAAIEDALGAKGTNNGGVYQFSIPRAETISAHGMTVPASVGTSTAINFQPRGDGKAAITGDFVTIGKEVNPVIKALRTNGIEVTALHSHMIDDSPHLYFMHFWANDNAAKLAKGARAALDLVNVKRGS